MRWLSIFLLLIGLAYPSLAFATAEIFFTFTETKVQTGDTGFPIFIGNVPALGGTADIGTDFASTVEISDSGANRGSAIAQTGFRTSQAIATVSKDDQGEVVAFAQAQALSRWSDTLTYGGGTGLGSTTYVFALTGVLSAPEGGQSQAKLFFDFEFDQEFSGCVACGTDSLDIDSQDPQDDDSLVFFLTTIFEYDIPFTLESTLRVFAELEGFRFGTATASYGTTLTLTEVIVPGGTTITSASGTDYSQVLVPVIRVDIDDDNDGNSTTQAGFLSLVNDVPVVSGGVTISISPFSDERTRTEVTSPTSLNSAYVADLTDIDALMEDFIFSLTPTVHITGLAAGTYNVESWHGDKDGNSDTIDINVTDADGTNVKVDAHMLDASSTVVPAMYTITSNGTDAIDIFLTVDSGGELRFNGLALETIPEPSAFAQSIAGLGALGCIGWRRRGKRMTR